jgi:predicted nucleic acid-binding Zn finger protein
MSNSLVPNDLEFNHILKLHYFVPSGRKLWTIIGKNNEYWLDPELDYCSCKHYYYKTLSGKEKCQHLRIFNEFLKKNNYDKITFSDEEYSSFLSTLIKDILRI